MADLLYYSTLSIDEWDSMSIEQWDTMVIEPTGTFREVAAEYFRAGSLIHHYLIAGSVQEDTQ